MRAFYILSDSSYQTINQANKKIIILNPIMDELPTPQKLFTRLQSPEKLRFITDTLGHSLIKVSKQVYNLSTRNIKHFIKEQRDMEMKKKAQVSTVKKQNHEKKKYDQNQLLELEFRLVDVEQNPVFLDKCKTQPSEIGSSSNRKNKSKLLSKLNQFNIVEFGQNLHSTNNRSALNRSKRVTYIEPNLTKKHIKHQSSDNLPRIAMRKKSQSTYDDMNSKIVLREFDISSKLRMSNLQKSVQSVKKSSSGILPNSSLLFGKRSNITGSQKATTEKMIQITDDKMMRYLKSLHTLINGAYEFGRPLDENKVNKLLLQRYSIPQQVKQSSNGLSTNQAQMKRFSLPFAQFISESETRKSIHRIVNMSTKNTQKVVFKLFDLNKNGLIDEKDIIDLAEMSQKVPQIKHDFLKIVRYMKKQDSFSVSNAQSMSYREDSQRQIEKMKDITTRYQSIDPPKRSQKILKVTNFIKSETKNQRSFTYHSSSEVTQFATNSNQNSNLDKSSIKSSFNKGRFYSFLESKNNFFNSKKNNDQFKFSIGLHDFQKIFSDERPLAFYDLIKFLFGVKKEDLIDQNIGQESEKLRKQSKPASKVLQKVSYDKNYNIPAIIKDFQNRFHCDIQMAKYKDILNMDKITQRQQQQKQ